MYRPSEPFTTVLGLYNPTTATVKGVLTKTYTFVDNINCSFKSYGGTELTSNDMTIVEDTASIETWYRPDIRSDSRLKLGSKAYEVIGEPENILMRNQTLKFKIRAVKGGA